jgi:hypothetical protein
VKRIVLLAVAASGCIKAPDLVLVDRKTALEQQAAGSFRGLSDDLEQAGLSPRPARLTHAQIDPGGADSAHALDEGEADSDTALIDELLLQRCIGEAREGTLSETPSSCTGTVDVARMTRTLERTNRNRLQMWRYLQSRRPKASLDDVRRVWRETHLKAVVCGGQVQRDDGAWEPKKC